MKKKKRTSDIRVLRYRHRLMVQLAALQHQLDRATDERERSQIARQIEELHERVFGQITQL